MSAQTRNDEAPKTARSWRRDIALVLISVILSGLITWLVSRYYYTKPQDQEIARYVVAAMLPQHPVKDSYELQHRVDEYLAALRKTKTDHRGTPVYRENGTIGIDWSINIKEDLTNKAGQ